MSLANLSGLAPASAAWLHQVGIDSVDKLHLTCALPAFIRLQQAGLKPSLNFLYALVAATEGRNWQEVAANDKGALLIAREGHRENQSSADQQSPHSS
ncbi:TfoX/Sxy family DNA transformation protein [Bowmanella dokdonensis]|uniref:TfoX/Sxy family DNA transformation protein n=1 Tax=Bowmanella dokdonensis TaxID=751969 RepID=A0A939IS28_9ALTE|nr:TfoX/Sxy family DNA transformation protein [Bowmanella dokdonensis]MBN7826006.1 TfoX/Sxy family DNA transformation protein [Bowmanella dokdonensis]